MRLPRRSSTKRSALAAGSDVAATSLLLAGRGSKATETDAANTESCVDTSGPTIKVGALNSLSGTMAISEVTVRHAIDLAVESVRSLPADTPLSMAFCARSRSIERGGRAGVTAS